MPFPITRRPHRAAPARRYRCAPRPCAESLEGRVLLATVSGVKFDDLDGDGVRDASEPGIAGWTIFHDDDNDSVMDAAEARVTTGSNGSYALSFPAGTGPGGTVPTPEWIREVPQAGWRQTLGPHLLASTLTQNWPNTHFGNTRLALVSGTKYNDLDLDGNQDASEGGLSGWTIYADLDNDNVRDFLEPSDTTDQSGRYSIALEASATAYRIREVLQPGWAQTEPSSGLHTTLLSAGESDTGRDFGNTNRGRINGQVVDDANGNGIYDIADTPLQNWTVYVDLNNDNSLTAGEPTDTTNSAGNFSFFLAGSATYTIREVRQSGWRQTFPAGDEYSVALAPGQVVQGRYFGNTRFGLITGQKVLDADADGGRDAGEPGLPDWEIYLDLNDNRIREANEPLDVTDADGRYSFSVATTRGYAVREVSRAGFRATEPLSVGHAVGWSSTGQTHAGLDFFNTNARLIHGSIFNDQNDDADHDTGEPFLNNWRVYADLNNNNTRDPGEPSDLTANGQYFLVVGPRPDNEPGNVTVRQEVQSGWRQTLPAPPPDGSGEYIVSIANGQVSNGSHWFGNTQRALFLGRKVDDLDANGVLAGGEPGVPGWTIYLDSNANNVLDAGEPTDVTDGDGVYRFSVVATGGNYVIREAPRTGWRQTGPESGEHIVRADLGRVVRDLHFFNTARPLITGAKFNDLDADGVRDAGEPGLSGWTIYHDANGNATMDTGEARTTTGPNGDYLLLPPPPGSPYRIREVPQAGWRQTSPASGEYNLGSIGGFTRTGADFGNTARPLVTGVKYEDVNANGTRDAGEPVLSGWTIYEDANNNGSLDAGELSNATDNQGRYTLVLANPGANPATTYIREVIQPGWLPVENRGGRQILASGGAIIDVDFGNARLATVNGVKFDDLDVDGVRDAGEPGLGGWTIYHDANDNGRLDELATPLRFTARDGLPRPTVDGGTVYSRNQVSGVPPVITGVQFERDLTHASEGDLRFALISPRGTRATVGTSDLMAVFDGEDPNGQWTLEVFDRGTADGGTAGTGSLDGWSLRIGSVEPSTGTSSTGGYSLTGLPPGTRVIREVLTDGWFQSAPAGGFHSVALASNGVLNNVNFGNARPGSISGTKFNDLDGDRVRDAGEGGLGGFVIYRDLDSDTTFDTERLHFDSTDTPKLIADATTLFGQPVPGFTFSTISTSGLAGRVADVNVTITLTHNRISDLSLSLSGSAGFSGRTVALVNANTLIGPGLTSTAFDDNGAAAIADGPAPYMGVFRPAQPLLLFEDMLPGGSWTLNVTDHVREVTGTLLSWSLDITLGEPFRVTDASGAYRFEGLRPGEVHVIREVQQPGWQQTAPAGVGGAYGVRLDSGGDQPGRDFGNRRVGPPLVVAVYARGTTWVGDDGDPYDLTFKEYLEARSLGDRVYGYRLSAGDILPWTNVNQLVIVYDSELPERVLPASVVVDGLRSDYTAVPSVLGPRVVLLTLDRVLGAPPGGGENGERLLLTDDFVAAGFQIRFNVLQGDANRNGTVLANDFSEVKRRFFRNTNAPGPADETQYSVFHDIDGSGSVLAIDASLVKQRFFDSLPSLAEAGTGTTAMLGAPPRRREWTGATDML